VTKDFTIMLVVQQRVVVGRADLPLLPLVVMRLM